MSTFERVRNKVLPVALMATLIGLTGGLPGQAAGATAAGPAAIALSPQLEAIRQSEAQALYGSTGVKPLAERKTSLISLGDSEIQPEVVAQPRHGSAAQPQGPGVLPRQSRGHGAGGRDGHLAL
ncbi:hypothetical protein [Embleya sp. NPDC005575]|uniref:hypothetical protein n=1 Tax=Embleya sp. NPDC005575 TaxID=3156892 RepID=UPI0033BBBAEF